MQSQSERWLPARTRATLVTIALALALVIPVVTFVGVRYFVWLLETSTLATIIALLVALGWWVVPGVFLFGYWVGERDKQGVRFGVEVGGNTLSSGLASLIAGVTNSYKTMEQVSERRARALSNDTVIEAVPLQLTERPVTDGETVEM